MEEILACPLCGSKMVLRKTTKFRYGNGEPRKFWGCSRYPECQATHGAHPDGRPLGVPGDTETKKLRYQLHLEMERIKKRWQYSKREMYRFMQMFTGLSEEDCHIAKFDKEQCLKIINQLKKI